MNETVTSNCDSDKTTAGLNLLPDKSVNGKGINNMVPFGINIFQQYRQWNKDLHHRSEIEKFLTFQQAFRFRFEVSVPRAVSVYSQQNLTPRQPFQLGVFSTFLLFFV